VWLTKSQHSVLPHAWTPDGLTLVLVEGPPGRPNNIQLLSVAEGNNAGPHPWREGDPPNSSDHLQPALSPDGRWLAYLTADEVYVDSFAKPGTRQQVSPDGGGGPLWSPDGRELFYIDRPSDHLRMMVVEVRASDELSLGVSRPLFEGEWAVTWRPSYDITPDGKRFLLVEVDPQLQPPTPPTQIHLILNWFEELKTKVGGGR
jgi:hypothetical protein